jgi:hypothetical protein
VLESADLIRTRKRGRVRTARLEADALRWVEEWTALHRAEWAHHLDDLGESLMQGDN